MEQRSDSYIQQVLQNAKTSFWMVGLFSFFINVLILTVPLYMLQIFDRVFASHSFDTLIFLTLIALIALIVLSVLDKIRSEILVIVSHWLDRKLTPEAIKRSADEILLGREYPLQSTKDITALKQFLCGSGMLAIMDAPWAPVFLIVIFIMSYVLGFIALGGAIILFSLAVINEILTRRMLGKANTKSLINQFHITATLRNAETIQAMGMMNNFVNNWEKDNHDVLEMQTRASRYSSLIVSTSKFIRLALQIIMLGVGAYLVIHNHLTSGVMIAATILLSRALAPVEQAISTWTQMNAAIEAYHRLKEYLGKPSHRFDSIKLPKPKGQLICTEVSFIPPGTQKPIVSRINLQFSPGEITVVLGASTSGKTTLARLLVGVWKPSSGNVRLDGADVFTWDREDFGRYVGYLPQNVELFPGTVKQNIGRMSDAAVDEEVIKAAQLAGIHEMILQLPRGYGTSLDDAGHRLSGGQRQRIALARALYGNPSLIILDEPNASLDAAGEEALTQVLKLKKQEAATVIVISHRPNLIELADRLLIMQNGQVMLFGPKDAVLARLDELHVQAGKFL